MKSIILKSKQGEELHPVSSSDLISHGESSVREAINSKQDILVSGSNIKTVNGESILGTGNIEISAEINTPDIKQYEYLPIILFTDMDNVRYTGGESPGQSIYQVSVGNTNNGKPIIVGTLLVTYDGEVGIQVFTGTINDMRYPSDSRGQYHVWRRTQNNDTTWNSWEEVTKPQVIAIPQAQYDEGIPDPDILYVITG